MVTDIELARLIVHGKRIVNEKISQDKKEAYYQEGVDCECPICVLDLPKDFVLITDEHEMQSIFRHIGIFADVDFLYVRYRDKTFTPYAGQGFVLKPMIPRPVVVYGAKGIPYPKLDLEAIWKDLSDYTDRTL